MTPAPLQVGQAPSELALNSAGFTPLAFANAVRIGSSSPVYVAGLLRREPLIAALVDRHHAVPAGDRAVDQRALARPGDAREHHQRAERDVDIDVLEVVGAGAAHLEPARWRPHRRLHRRAVVQVAPGQRAAGPQPFERPLEDHLAAGGPGAGTQVDDMVGDGDDLGLVLDDEHRVALVAQPQQQAVHPGDVVRMEPDRGLVEDVRDVGQRRAEVADHPRALGLAARQRARRPVEREIAQPDLDERVERVLEAGEQRRDRRLVQAAQPRGEIVELHRAGVGDVDPVDLRRPGRLVEPGAAAVGAGGEGHRAFHERADMRLERVDILRQHRLLDPRDESVEGQVDPFDLDLGRLRVEQVIEILRAVVADRLVHVEAGAREDAAPPPLHAVARDRERTLSSDLLAS